MFLALPETIGPLVVSCNFTDRRRQCNLYGLKDLSGISLALCTDSKAFISFFNSNQLKDFGVLFDVGLFKHMTGIVEAPFQFFSQDQRLKAAKHVAPGRTGNMTLEGEYDHYFNHSENGQDQG